MTTVNITKVQEIGPWFVVEGNIDGGDTIGVKLDKKEYTTKELIAQAIIDQNEGIIDRDDLEGEVVIE